MMLADAPDRTEQLDLIVEAGGSIETALQVIGTRVDGTAELRLLGVPPSWYSLSMQSSVPPGSREPVQALLVIHPPRLEHGGNPGLYDVRLEGVDAAPSAWRVRVVPPGFEVGHPQLSPVSRLLEFLPRHYRTDEFLGRFLYIFQTALDPIEQSIDTTHLLLDPGLAPAGLLEWLGSWLDLDLQATPDVETRRILIERAVELYRWKGTRRGLRAELDLRLETPALIVENFDGLRLGHDAALGVNTQLGRRCDGSIVITLARPPDSESDILDQAGELVDAVRPAGCGYVVRLAPTPAPQGEVVDGWQS
ncbi:MAG: hypothetical protein JOY61_13465 [Chloroflexi bacterium]|nr:hypothetical protein [Chloroflexota bacterium]